MGTRLGSSPCTNHPMKCPACNKEIRAYGTEAHYEESEAHPSRVPIHLVISVAQKKEVLAWKLGRKGTRTDPSGCNAVQ